VRTITNHDWSIYYDLRLYLDNNYIKKAHYFTIQEIMLVQLSTFNSSRFVNYLFAPCPRLSRHDSAITKRTSEPPWVRTNITRKSSDIRGAICTRVRKCWHLIIVVPRAAIRKTSALSAISVPHRAAAKVTGRKEWSAKLYTDRKSRGIIPVRPVALERLARHTIRSQPRRAPMISKPSTVQ